MIRQRKACLLLITLGIASFAGLRAEPAGRLPVSRTAATSDSVYNAHHPRLLFSAADIPALKAKIQDGGRADQAYDFIMLFVDMIYPTSTYTDLLGTDFGLGTVPNLGLATHLETPEDAAARELGKNLTLYIANGWSVDGDEYNSALRLRSLALGYDMFFQNASPGERDAVKNEIIAYVDTMLEKRSFETYLFRPYLGNTSAMIAASLGLAAVCLADEMDPATVENALDMAADLTYGWLNYLLDERGAYNEGLLYGGWSMRNLVYYFDALKRYNGYNFADKSKIRNMERWFVYELLPEGSSRTNNLNECAYSDWALSKHNTYTEWAQSEWNSPLAAWLWDHTCGSAYGYDYGIKADKAATVLWHKELVPVQPDSILPNAYLWEERGLYYYRTGWQSAKTSKDVLFSFYSGKYQGGHAQEDQNNFTLNAYGAKFAIDHGMGTTAKQSEAHNLVFIDGLGQHNAGATIGTDGKIAQFLLNDFADCIVGDATAAYTTYSYFNSPGYPFEYSDWSWGYDGGNPVNKAFRKVLAVHDAATPPYFIIMDDIEKDGSMHDYEWRMHTYYSYAIDTMQNPVRITYSTAFLNVYALDPLFGELRKNIRYFNNLTGDPDSRILSFSTDAVNPHFTFLLLPGDATVVPPVVSRESFPWGLAVTVEWSGGKTDILLCNYSGGAITYTGASPALLSSGGGGVDAALDRSPIDAPSIATDAETAVLRTTDGRLDRYMLSNVTSCSYNDTVYASSANGPFSAALSGDAISIDRYDADFTFYAPGVEYIYYQGQQIHVTSDGGYLTPDPASGAGGDVPLRPFVAVDAYPNPFNPSTTIRVNMPERGRVRITIYDSLGRAVKTLWEGSMEAGSNPVLWNGSNNFGAPVASGIYFVRVEAGAFSQTLKLAVIK
ncbi:MAG: T9SS type A sorting domain-containing protein [Chitinivibrionia bacterium]|nr:T9SS type A sorting domain-containing protein [Chitinivibrionia bacterium]